MVNTEIRLIIFFAVKEGEAQYSQEKQGWGGLGRGGGGYSVCKCSSTLVLIGVLEIF